MASTVQEKDIKKLREAEYLAKKSAPVSRQRDRSFLLWNPMRGWCSFPTLSAG